MIKKRQETFKKIMNDETISDIDKGIEINSAPLRALDYINKLQQQNKRYRGLLERVDYLLEKSGETDEDIYDLTRHARTLIYLEGEE